MVNLYSELESAVSEAFKGPEVKKGYLGYVINGAFTVVVTRDTSLYYVRYDDGSFEEVPHKGRVSPQRNAPVKVGFDDTGERSILGINREEAPSFAGAAASGSMAVGPHSHERGSSLQYLVDPYLLTPLRVKLSSGTTIEIKEGRYRDSFGDLHWRNIEEIDIDSYITGTSYHHSWLVVWINQDTGASGVTSGTSQTISLPLRKSDISSISLPDGSIPLVAIPAKNGQSTLYEVDFEDLRYVVALGGRSDFANQELSNLAASVAINTSLISDTDSTDDLGSSSIYWRNGYIDTVYVSEQSAPSTPPTGKVVIYAKTDGHVYAKDDTGAEINLSMSAFSGLSDVDMTGLANGNVPVWNSGTGKWEPGPAGGSFSGDAGDVPYTVAESGDWPDVPVDVESALDSLAASVADLVAGGGVPLTVKEVDGTPSIANVSEIQIPNTLLTDLGSGVARLSRSRRDLYGEPDGSLMGLTPNYWQEFDGSSLPGDWSVAGGSFTAGPTADGGRSCVEIETSTTVPYYVHTLTNPISGDFDFETKVWMDTFTTTASTNGAELVLHDSSSNIIVSAYFYHASSQYYYQAYGLVTGTNYATGNQQLPLLMSRSVPYYFRFTRVSGVVSIYQSMDGENWVFMSSKSSVTTTIDKMSFRPYRQAGSATTKFRAFYARINS